MRTYMLLAVGLLAVSPGCSLLGRKSLPVSDSQSVSAVSPGPAAEPAIKLSYETDSSRFELLGGAPAGTARQVAYTPNPAGDLSRFTECRVNVVAPHPRAIPGMAQVHVLFAAELEEQDNSTLGAIWARIAGQDNEDNSEQASALGAGLPREIWTMDIPVWQVQRLVAQLREEQFFRRQRALSTEAHLATEIDGVRFGKDVAAISQLDALALRIRREGRLLHRSGMPLGSPPMGKMAYAAPPLAAPPHAAPPAGPGQVGPGQVSPGQLSPGQLSPGQLSPGPEDYSSSPSGPRRLPAVPSTGIEAVYSGNAR